MTMGSSTVTPAGTRTSAPPAGNAVASSVKASVDEAATDPKRSSPSAAASRPRSQPGPCIRPAVSCLRVDIRGTWAAPAPPASLPAEGGMNVGEGVEFDVLNAPHLAPLGEAALGEQDVGEQGRLAI